MITQCPNCKARFKARDDWKGKETKCPKCKKPFTVVELGRAQQPSRAPDPAIETAKPEKLSDTVYVYSVACALAVSIFLFILVQFCLRERDRDFLVFAGILALIGTVVGIYSTVVRFVLYYKMWAAIQDGHARTSAGKAVGFLLVPLLDIYWALYMFVGFAKDYNDFARRHSIRTERLSEGLFLQYAILWVFLDISFITLYVLPLFGVGDEIFGGLYVSFGPRNAFGYFAVLWKLSNVACMVWLFITYIKLSTRICRAVDAI